MREKISDINTASVVLAYGTWIVGALFSASISFAVMTVQSIPLNHAKPLAIGWASVSFALILWTLVAIIRTWKVIAYARSPIFGVDILSLLFVILAICAGIAIWSIVVISLI